MFLADRRLLSVLALAASALVAGCGEDQPSSNNDAGPVGPVACESSGQCAAGFLCSGGICVENVCHNAADCPSGWSCDDLNGLCKENEVPDGGGTDGGEVTDGGTDGGEVPDGGPITCQTKYDCPPDQICKLSTHLCVPKPNNTCNSDLDCARGKICNFSKQCEDGCVDKRDCAEPKLCHPEKFVCEACSLRNPCAAGSNCIGGECKVAVACTGPSASGCVAAGLDGTVCLGGFCVNCSGHGDCRVDPYVDNANPNKSRICAQDGLCKQVTCTDPNCQNTLGPRGYCDTATNQCAQRGCLSSTDCSEPTPICDTVSNSCTATPENCDTAACEADCSSRPPDPMTGMPPECNTATCTCGGGGGGAGCVVDTDCAPGEACGLGVCTPQAMTADGDVCDATTCALGSFIGDPCVSSADPSIECDGTACFFSLLFGGGGAAAPCL